MLRLIFFLSGVAGLIYQVIWVREFGYIFGNTFQSASIVVGTFVFNLGVGSYLGGLLIDRYHKSEPRVGLAAYIGAEIIIGLFGLILAFAIPMLEPLSALISSYELGEHSWYFLSTFSYISRYILSSTLLVVPTLLMGATLTFLIRYVLQEDLSKAGWHIGLLYGANTLGAAIGCLFVDLFSISIIGIFATKLFAVALNLTAAYLAFQMFKPGKLTLKPELGYSNALLSNLKPTHIGIAIFVSGFAAMGLEIVWFRYLSSVLSATRQTFSILLGVILIGMWLGAITGGRLSRRKTNPGWFYIASQLGLAISALGCLLLLINMDRAWVPKYLFSQKDIMNDLLWTLWLQVYYWPIAVVVALPAFFMGFAFPLANAIIQRSPDKVGVNAGHIYIWNSTGSLLGSLCAGFLLLPILGSQLSFLLLAGISVVAILPLTMGLVNDGEFRGPQFKSFRRLSAAGLVVIIGLCLTWINKSPWTIIRASFQGDPIELRNEKILATSEGILETVVVSEAPDDGSGRPFRKLYTNGHTMSGTSYVAQRYMRAFVHIPLLQLDKPTDALVICFGVGNTANALSYHDSITNIEIADISKNVLEHAEYFRPTNHGVISDPRVKVFVNDGRQHLRMQKESSYDLVTLEPPPMIHAGVSSLYSVEFYELVLRTLKPNGFLSQWWPAYQLTSDTSKSLIAAFIQVFPNSVLLHGSGGEFILLGQKSGPNQIDPQQVLANLASRPTVQKDLESIDMANIIEILGSFVSSPKHLEKAVKGFEPITDDYPIMEYHAQLFRDYLDPKFFNTDDIESWCPKCFDGDEVLGQFGDLPGYLKVTQSIYWNTTFADLNIRKKDKAIIRVPKVDVDPYEFARIARKYPFLQEFYGNAKSD